MVVWTKRLTLLQGRQQRIKGGGVAHLNPMEKLFFSFFSITKVKKIILNPPVSTDPACISELCSYQHNSNYDRFAQQKVDFFITDLFLKKAVCFVFISPFTSSQRIYLSSFEMTFLIQKRSLSKVFDMNFYTIRDWIVRQQEKYELQAHQSSYYYQHSLSLLMFSLCFLLAPSLFS